MKLRVCEVLSTQANSQNLAYWHSFEIHSFQVYYRESSSVSMSRLMTAIGLYWKWRESLDLIVTVSKTLSKQSCMCIFWSIENCQCIGKIEKNLGSHCKEVCMNNINFASFSCIDHHIDCLRKNCLKQECRGPKIGDEKVGALNHWIFSTSTVKRHYDWRSQFSDFEGFPWFMNASYTRHFINA